jgi:predicted transcriptional regulator
MTTSKKQNDKDFTKWERQLKDAIKSSEMTLVEIAECSDVDYSQLYRFFRGQRKQITFRTAEKVAKVVGLELKEIRK